MTRRDYKLLTEVLRDRRLNAKHLDKLGWTDNEVRTAIDVIDDIAYHLSSNLWQDNKAFNTELFIKNVKGEQ